MPLPDAVKFELVDRFMPLLYMAIDEPDLPVDPTAYVESAALWSSPPPEHRKLEWGQPDGSDRRPLIERHGISLDPSHDVQGSSDPDGDGVPEHYLGQSTEGTFPFLDPDGSETWLDLAGWQLGEQVTPSSLNRRTEPGPRPPLPQPWFSADVWTLDDLSAQLGRKAMAARFGLGPEDAAPALEGMVVVAFHFLFPLHRQPRRTTALAPEDDRYTGDYEGDWATFSVIGRAPGSPADVTSPAEVEPTHVGYARRWKGVDRDYEDGAAERVFLQEWSQALCVGEHPVVVAAAGTHNLYPHDPPLTAAGTIEPQFFDMDQGIGEVPAKLGQDILEQAWVAVFAAKVIAGGAVGGVLGPIGGIVGAGVGLLAAALEAPWAAEEGLVETPPLEQNPPPQNDNPLADDAVDLEKAKMGVPQGIANPPLADLTQSEVHEWQVPTARSLVDGSILFEPSADGKRPAYAGRWGVRCAEDPFLRRSGIRFPAHRPLVVDALLTQT